MLIIIYNFEAILRLIVVTTTCESQWINERGREKIDLALSKIALKLQVVLSTELNYNTISYFAIKVILSWTVSRETRKWKEMNRTVTNVSIFAETLHFTTSIEYLYRSDKYTKRSRTPLCYGRTRIIQFHSVRDLIEERERKTLSSVLCDQFSCTLTL